MNNKQILGIGLIGLNVSVLLIVAMIIWKSRKVDKYVYVMDQ